MSPAKKFGSKLKAIKETLESEGKTPMKTQRMVDRIMSKKKAEYEKKKYLTGGQAKLDKNKNNKIDAQDFKILRAEKAKGRGQGLQDEKMKPGKPMKAALGAIALGLGAKKMKEKGKMMPMGIGAAGYLAKKKKEMLGKKRGGMSKSSQGTTAKSAMGKTFSGYQKVFKTGVSAGDKAKATSTIIGVKPKLPEASKKSKIARRALRAAQATRFGKMLLPVAAAGVAAQQYLKSKMKKKKELKGDVKGSASPYLKKKMGGGMMQKYAEGGDAKRSPVAEQQRKMGQRKKKAGLLGGVGRAAGRPAVPRRTGLPALPGKRKEDSSVTLGKFMKAKVDALNESVKAGGMKKERITEGSNMRSPRRFVRDVEEGKYSKPNKDAAYYKSIGLTGERGDRAVKTFFAPRKFKMNVGGSVTVKTKLGRNKPTKMY